MIVCEYSCPHHGRFEYLESHEPRDTRDCPTCECESPYCISAPAIKPNYASVTQGKGSSERPKDFISTSLLADGMKHSEWREVNAKRRKDRLREHVRSKI